MVPPPKQVRLQTGAKSIICGSLRRRRWIASRVLAGFAGLAQSVQLALPRARLYLRSFFDVLKTKRNWDSDVRLSKQALRDLQWWTTLDEIHCRRAIYREATMATLFSDASKRGWGGLLNGQVICHGLWTEKEREAHITELELLAVAKNVAVLLPQLKRRRVLLLEDNAAVVWISYNKASRAPRLMMHLRNLIGLLDMNDTTLEVRYVSTHSNKADMPSRFQGTDHWRLRASVFRRMESLAGLRHTVDRFACRATALVPRYNAPYPEPGAEAVDGLSQSWLHEVNWLNPPPDLLPNVLSRLEREPGIHGTLVTPYWPAESWFAAAQRVSRCARVLPSAAAAVCPIVQRKYGITGPGRWPLVFWQLEGRVPDPTVGPRPFQFTWLDR